MKFELKIAQERLRQARYSFNLAIAATTVSFLISILGGALLLSNKASEASKRDSCGFIFQCWFCQVSQRCQ